MSDWQTVHDSNHWLVQMSTHDNDAVAEVRVFAVLTLDEPRWFGNELPGSASLDEAETWATGFLKFDGCMQLGMTEEGCTQIHLDTNEADEAFAAMLRAIRAAGPRMIPRWMP